MIQIPQDIKDTFRNIGLGISEQQVYFALLQNGQMGIQAITKYLKLPRSSVQLACEGLLERGVLKVSIYGKRRNFYIDNPKNIENFINHEQNKIQKQKLELIGILPKLNSFFAISQNIEPIHIEEFKGEDGFVEVFNKPLELPFGSEILRFSCDPTVFNIKRDELKKYREKRMKKKIFTRLILPESLISEEQAKEAKFKMREVRILNKEIYNPNVNASVWGDNVSMTVWDKGLHSIIIRNKSIAEFMKQVFEIAWSKSNT